MKQLPAAVRYSLALLVSALPFALNAIFWKSGCVDEMLWFFPVLALLTWLNYRCSDGWMSFLLLQLFLIPFAIGKAKAGR